MSMKQFSRRCARVLVLLPGVYGICVLLYFNFLSEAIPLENVFAPFIILSIPSNITAVFFVIVCVLHLFRSSKEKTALEKILWLLSLLTVTGISLPVYWYRYMTEETPAI